jgi:outer membrane lipoprotein SlyB
MKAPIKRWRLVGQISRIQAPEAKGDVPAEMEITFTTLTNVISGDKRDYAIQGVLSEVGGNTKKRNTGIMIGGAVAGAILGKKVGGDTKDAVIGAAAGAGIGAGVVRALPGKHIALAKDDALTITLTADAILPVAEDKK